MHSFEAKRKLLEESNHPASSFGPVTKRRKVTGSILGGHLSAESLRENSALSGSSNNTNTSTSNGSSGRSPAESGARTKLRLAERCDPHIDPLSSMRSSKPDQSSRRDSTHIVNNHASLLAADASSAAVRGKQHRLRIPIENDSPADWPPDRHSVTPGYDTVSGAPAMNSSARRKRKQRLASPGSLVETESGDDVLSASFNSGTSKVRTSTTEGTSFATGSGMTPSGSQSKSASRAPGVANNGAARDDVFARRRQPGSAQIAAIPAASKLKIPNLATPKVVSSEANVGSRPSDRRGDLSDSPRIRNRSSSPFHGLGMRLSPPDDVSQFHRAAGQPGGIGLERMSEPRNRNVASSIAGGRGFVLAAEKSPASAKAAPRQSQGKVVKAGPSISRLGVDHPAVAPAPSSSYSKGMNNDAWNQKGEAASTAMTRSSVEGVNVLRSHILELDNRPSAQHQDRRLAILGSDVERPRDVEAAFRDAPYSEHVSHASGDRSAAPDRDTNVSKEPIADLDHGQEALHRLHNCMISLSQETHVRGASAANPALDHRAHRHAEAPLDCRDHSPTTSLLGLKELSMHIAANEDQLAIAPAKSPLTNFSQSLIATQRPDSLLRKILDPYSEYPSAPGIARVLSVPTSTSLVLDPDSLALSEVQKVIDKHLRDLRNDHEYKVHRQMTRARHYQRPDFHALRTESGLPSRAPNGMMGLVHTVSPFDRLAPIDVTITSQADMDQNHMQMCVKRFNKPVSKATYKSYTACPIRQPKPEDTELANYIGDMPQYTHFFGLKRSILGENARQMHVWPYFQYEADYVAGEGKVYTDLRNEFDVDVEQWPRKVHRSQQVQTYGQYAEAFLEDIKSSMSDVLYYFLESDEAIIQSASEGCKDRNKLCREDFNRSTSRWVKVFSSLPRPDPDGLRRAALACTAFSNALPRFTAHSKDLTLWHIARKSQAARLYNPAPQTETDPFGLACRVCYTHDCPYHGEIRQSDSEAEDNESLVSDDALDTDYPPNVNFKRRVVLPARHSSDLTNVAQALSLKSHKSKGLENLIWDHYKRGPFYPCHHPKQTCDQADCRCFRDKVACEKTCSCSYSCNRRFRGCSCKKGPGNKKRCLQDDRCICFRFNRECDPDLCGDCGVDLILDRENHTDHNEFDELRTWCCRNASIQLGFPKRTLLGTSTVQGFGLFAGESIKKDEFVGEYVGEIITIGETERRGAIYEVQKLSYLFKLNRDQEVDSQRFGNKIRFINHADTESRARNIYPSIMLCNTTHRIGMYASKDIETTQELFFDYGKDYHQDLVGGVRPHSDGAPKPGIDLSSRISHDPDHDQAGPRQGTMLLESARSTKSRPVLEDNIIRSRSASVSTSVGSANLVAPPTHRPAAIKTVRSKRRRRRITDLAAHIERSAAHLADESVQLHDGCSGLQSDSRRSAASIGPHEVVDSEEEGKKRDVDVDADAEEDSEDGSDVLRRSSRRDRRRSLRARTIGSE